VPIDPAMFAAEFITRIRDSPVIPEAFKPSTRQPIAIAKLLSAKLMRQHRLQQTDFIEAAVVTSNVEIKADAEKIAVETWVYLARSMTEVFEGLAIELVESIAGNPPSEKVLDEWFRNRDDYSEEQKKRLLLRAREALEKIGLYYGRYFINNFYTPGTGPEKGYATRRYRNGIDDPSAIDFELSLEEALVNGKKAEYLSYEDFLTRQVRRERRSVLYLQDASASFDYRVLLSSAICGSMLVHGLPRDDQTGIALFSDNVEVVKKISGRQDLTQITDKLLSMEPLGGTKLFNALKWARSQFEQVGRNYVKFCLIFSDMGFEKEDVEHSLEEISTLQNMGVQIFFLKFHPFAHYYKEGLKMLDESGCSMINVEDVKDFPELMSRIISPS